MPALAPKQCSTCNVECAAAYYHALKQPSSDICHFCLIDGRFPSSLYSGDYVLVSQTKTPTTSWTDSEILLLLEGLEMYDEDWSKISEHVGTKSRDACIIHFLALPIEDVYLPTDNSLNAGRMFTSAAENPVLSLAAFMSTLVSSQVAKSAAEAAISKVNQLEAEKIESAKSDPNYTQLLDQMNPETMSAAGLSLGAAAAKAHILSLHTERESSRLVLAVTQLELKKVQLKMSFFEACESFVEMEKTQLAKEKQEFYAERLKFRKEVESLGLVDGEGDLKMGKGYGYETGQLEGEGIKFGAVNVVKRNVDLNETNEMNLDTSRIITSV